MMSQQVSVPPRTTMRDGGPQLQLVRRYARLLRETAATTGPARRSPARATAPQEAPAAGDLTSR